MFQFTRPQGARPNGSTITNNWSRFNSRARKGRDLIITTITGFTDMFQFTRPQGARPNGSTITNNWSRFNSRARKGRD